MKHAVLLIPGFFGYANLGGVEYFRHVRAILEERFAHYGEEIRVVPIRTLPTGSIRKRAKILAVAVNEICKEGCDRIHLIGHSTGGLDARLFASPGVSLGPEEDKVQHVVDTIVTMATPHYGTPIASFFGNLAGKHILMGLTLFMLLSMHFGRSFAWAGRLFSYVTRLDDILGFDNTLLDYLSNALLKDFTPERRAEITAFMNSIHRDRGGLLQITAEGMDIFNAVTVNAESVRYLSYITAAPRPESSIVFKHFLNPYFDASYPLFVTLHRLAQAAEEVYPYPPFPQELTEQALQAFGFFPNKKDNDGVVPTCSQIWGNVAGLVRSDHLDICGHFYSKGREKMHTDWLYSASGFNRLTFESVYRDLAARLLGKALPPSLSKSFVSL